MGYDSLDREIDWPGFWDGGQRMDVNWVVVDFDATAQNAMRMSFFACNRPHFRVIPRCCSQSGHVALHPAIGKGLRQSRGVHRSANRQLEFRR